VVPPARRAAGTLSPNERNVVVLVIDGPRGSEAFEDTLHTNVPRMWNDLRPLGTFFPNFGNHGLTLTNPGHSSMATGTWQTIDNSGVERPDRPTIFEYFRQATGAPATDAYVISGKAKLDVLTYSTDSTYGASYGATSHVGLSGDAAVYNDLLNVLSTEHPRLVFACFPDVDLNGHGGVFANYVAAIRNVDSLVAGVWNWLQADSFYAGRTYLLVSADHGRHDDAHGGFRNHGDGCDGCRRLFCLALGPNVRANHTVTNLYLQRDICPTIGVLLGVPTPESEGVVMQEMFEPVVTGVGDDP
jgi:hypothetical protein